MSRAEGGVFRDLWSRAVRTYGGLVTVDAAEAEVAEMSSGLERSRLARVLQSFAAALLLFPVAIYGVALVVLACGYSLGWWLLPAGTVLTVGVLRPFCTSWSHVARIAGVAALLHLVAGVFSAMFYDVSYDGVAYHQEAMLRLVDGWNPVHGDPAEFGEMHSIWIRHYPNGSWVNGAAFLIATDRIEAGKLLNLTLMLAAGAQVATMLLRLTPMRMSAVVAIAGVAALNPVAIYQSLSFCVDGALASVFTVAVAAFLLYIAKPAMSVFCIGIMALMLMMSFKLNGLVYGVVLLGALVAAIWWRFGFRSALRLGALSFVVGVILVFAVNYAPYTRNLAEKGHIFYPVMGSPDVLKTGNMRPANLADENRFSRFIISSFSRSERVRSPDSTRLKIPFTVGRHEARRWSADTESGGYGPFYGGLLILSAIGILVLLADPGTRKAGAVAAGIEAVLVASMFLHDETWWARYIPQAWLIPIVVAATCLCFSSVSRCRRLGWVITGIAVLNVAYIGAFYMKQNWLATRAVHQYLAEVRKAEMPVRVYFGPFESLRQRLNESGIDFRGVAEAPRPEEVSVKYRINDPAGRAYAFE